MNSKVLILVINFNSSEYIGDCLSSLEKITYPRELFEVMVIDNASTDDSVQKVKASWPRVKLILNESNLGFAAANNLGFEYAIKNNFDYVYLLNQDTVVESDFLEVAVDLAQTDQKIGSVQSKLLLYNDKIRINSIGNEIHYLGFAFAGGYKQADQGIVGREITYASGASCLVRIEALNKVGLFDPEFFMYHEDVDLGWRLWLAGYRNILAPDSVVYHKYDFTRSIQKYYYMERNRRLVIFQNYKIPTLILFLPALFFMEIGLAFFAGLGGWGKEFIKSWSYFLSYQHWQHIFKNRERIKKIRQLKDRDLLKKFVGKIEFQDIQNPVLKYFANPAFNFYFILIRMLVWW